MRRSLLLTCCLLFSGAVFSQKIPLIRSGEIITKAMQLYDSGKYTESIHEFLTVPKRDTNYVYMLSELALAYVANKENDLAIKVCEEALEGPSTFKAHLMRTKAIATDHKGDFEGGVKLFEKCIEKYPFDFSAVYNLGITYYNHKDYDKAIDCFFKVLSLNPYHSGSHLNLGRISMGQGKKTHAMLSFGMYLAINNNDNDRLVLLEKFVTNQFAEEGTLPGDIPNAFERLDQIIKAKIALDNKFKSKVPVDAGLVKQYQMLFEQLQTADASIEDRWANYYLPVYKSLNENNALEPFTYHILTSIDNSDVKKWLKKNDTRLKQFYDIVNTGLRKNSATITATAAGFAKAIHAEYYDDHRLRSLGEEETSGTKHGRWVYFYSNNEITAEGDYDAKGEKTGIWKYYYENGNAKSIENLATGDVQSFYENGQNEERFVIKNDSIQGDATTYYSCGALRETSSFDKGKRNGPGKTFFPTGKVKSTYQYERGNIVGDYVTYFENGQLQSKASYKNGELDGAYMSYWANGKTRIAGTNSHDKAEGTWKYYYANGRMERAGNYKNDLAVGEWVYYNQRGNLTEKRNFDNNGNFEGANTFYHDGKVQHVKMYKKDILTSLVYYGQDGKELGKFGNGDGSFSSKHFFPEGQISSEGSYKKGQLNGLWKYYYHNGSKKSEYNYQDGKLHGKGFEYFKSGQVKSSRVYVDGELDGYYQEFYVSGKVKEEGWFQGGQRQQQWLNYYPNDSLESDYYYLNDELSSLCLDYNTDGKLYMESMYDKGNLQDMKNYNRKGKMITVRSGTSDRVIYETKYTDGKPQFRSEVTCGNNSGSISQWFPDGKLFYTYLFMEGKKHGTYQSKTLTGSQKMIGDYSDGERTGLWKSYYDNGQLEYNGYYLQDEDDSTWTFYYPTGKIYSVSNYIDGSREGVYKIYSPEGTLLLEKLYANGDLIAYRTIDKDDKPGDWISFNGTGSITAYYKSGVKGWDETFKNGLLEGPKRVYFGSGKIYSEYTFRLGDYEGNYSIYYPTGKLLEKGIYRADELDGPVEVYNEDGTLMSVENYLVGMRNGKSSVYNKGSKLKEYNFWANKIDE